MSSRPAHGPKGSVCTSTEAEYENQSKYYSTSIHNHTNLCGDTARATSPTRINEEDMSNARETPRHDDTIALEAPVPDETVAQAERAKQDILNGMHDAFTSNLVAKDADQVMPVDSSSRTAREMKQMQKLKILNRIIEADRETHDLEMNFNKIDSFGKEDTANGQVERVSDFSSRCPAPGWAGSSLRRDRGTGCPPTCGRCACDPKQLRSGVGRKQDIGAGSGAVD